MGWESDHKAGYDKGSTLHGKSADQVSNREAFIKGEWAAWHERQAAQNASQNRSIFGNSPPKSSSSFSSGGGSAFLGAICLIAFIGYFISGGSNKTTPSSQSNSQPEAIRAAAHLMRVNTSTPILLGSEWPHLTSAPEKQSCYCDAYAGPSAGQLPPNALVQVTDETDVENRRGLNWTTVKFYHVVAVNRDGSPNQRLQGWAGANLFSPASGR